MPSRWNWHPETFMNRIDALVKAKVMAAVYVYERELQTLFRSAKSGRLYRVGSTPTKADRAAGRTYRSHQASAPGEAPAVWYGTLRRSISHKIERLGWAQYRAQIGTNVRYAMYLEFGTKRIAARPAWRPAFDITRKKIAEVMARGEGKE